MNDVKGQTKPPLIVIVFGITGDLAAKKVIPSLWHLFERGRLPGNTRVLGLASGEIPRDAFEEMVKSALASHGHSTLAEADLDRFIEIFSYYAGDFKDGAVFSTLATAIKEIETSWGVCANKLFYAAVAPRLYEPILRNLASEKLNVPCGDESGWSRLLIEKPFGSDLAGAQELEALLSSYFKEEQIYRIDHYLFKEIVQGIENFRFSNNLFESTWDNQTIERIDLRLHETIGVEDRGAFYDTVGALRDVGQNHLLSMLAAITMEYPIGMDASDVRKNRKDILESLASWTKETLRLQTFRAQYVGYREVQDVQPDSETETYFALKTEIDSSRWKGVPIFIEAGKRMAKAQKEIVVTIKHPDKCALCQVGEHAPNKIIFRLEPNDEIVIHFWMKKPGFEEVIEERVFSFFLYEKETKAQYVEEYSKVLYSAMVGRQSLFVAADEVEALWKFTDPIEAAWSGGKAPLASYEPGTTPTAPFLETTDDSKEHLEARGARVDSAKTVGMIGLGKMGANLSRQLMAKGWRVVGFNKSPERADAMTAEGLEAAHSLEELARSLSAPRLIWLMVPHGVVGEVLDALVPFLEHGDVVVDGGNSPYKESIRRAQELKLKGIGFLDIGVSGGPDGARRGSCMMAGGDRELYDALSKRGFFYDTCVSQGWGYMGPSGAGHFVKMVHNGIEYGMMQSIAEGFDLLRHSDEFTIDLEAVARVYSHGSVISSSLISWLHDALQKYGADLRGITGSAAASGEGAWTLEAGEREQILMPAIRAALDTRSLSQEKPSYQGRAVSAMRGEFGGHPVARGEDEPEVL